MLARLWNHYTTEAKSPEAWKALTEDYLDHLQGYPAPVIERAIAIGQREWGDFRPTIAKMLKACEQALKQEPQQPSREYDGSNSRGGWIVGRRAELTSGWLNSHAQLAAEARDGGWYIYLRREVEDGANILAQIEWELRNGAEHYRPPVHHTANLFNDPVRGWQIFIAEQKLARWRAMRRDAA